MTKFGNIKMKAAAIIAASTGLLTHTAQAKRAMISNTTNFGDTISECKSVLIPRLVLKLNFNRPGESKLVSHSSHSSQESHSSHPSHGSGYSGGGDGGGSFIGPLLLVGGLAGGLWDL
jgi:hypothetical protein